MNWIEINLPWYKYSDTYSEAYPDLDLEIPKECKTVIEINTWYNLQPECIEYEKRREAYVQQQDQLSFCGRKLNRPGTLIELEDGKQYLIGNINTLGGVCDDCSAFDNNELIVKRYCVVWSAPLTSGVECIG